MATNRAGDEVDLTTWIGRTESTRDVVGPTPVAALHATLDIKHSEAWNREILTTLVAEQPGLARPIAEGALMRLQAGARCFARYRREFGLDS